MLNFAEVDQLETPCFVLDAQVLGQNFVDFRHALEEKWSDKSHVAYSVKTNPFPWILSKARTAGCLAEVVSDEEFNLALAQGFAPCEIVFNGPIKSRDWLNFALNNGTYVNLDSRREIEWVKEYAAATSRLVKVGVRANIELEKYCPGETLFEEHHGRFGFSFEGGDFARVVDELRAFDEGDIVVSGLHMHATTRSRSNNVYRMLARYAARIVEECELSLDYVDIGGGFFGGGPLNVGAYEEYVFTIESELGKVCDPDKVELIVEPGGAVVCTPGYYVGRVVDVKDILDERYVVTELSRVNIDHEMKKTSYNLTLHAVSSDTHPSQILCGYTCMDSDRLCELVDAVELSPGDIVVVNNAGAYSMAFTPNMFIKCPPAVYIKDGDIIEIERQPSFVRPPCGIWE